MTRALGTLAPASFAAASALALAGAPSPPAAVAADPALVVVVGVSGTPEHRERFEGWALALCRAAVSRPEPVFVRVLSESALSADGEESFGEDPSCRPAAPSTRDGIADQIESASGQLGVGDGLFVVLIGHGSGDGRDARFNLPGPDLSPEGLAAMLDGAGGDAVTVANLSSSSGAFLPALSAPGRVLVAAARAGEVNETRFPGHFVAAFEDRAADRDRDGRVSVLEAFEFARLAVIREYDEEGLLRTEHPLLDDDGDGAGSLEPLAAPGTASRSPAGDDAAGPDGALAARVHPLAPAVSAALAEAAGENPELRELLAEREELSGQVDALRGLRAEMDETAWFEELERLLVRMAEISDRIAELDPGNRE